MNEEDQLKYYGEFMVQKQKEFNVYCKLCDFMDWITGKMKEEHLEKDEETLNWLKGSQ